MVSRPAARLDSLRIGATRVNACGPRHGTLESTPTEAFFGRCGNAPLHGQFADEAAAEVPKVRVRARSGSWAAEQRHRAVRSSARDGRHPRSRRTTSSPVGSVIGIVKLA